MPMRAFADQAGAATFEEGGIEYTVTSESEVSIESQASRFDSINPHLVIPGTVRGYTVSKIGSYAFSGCTRLVSVSIPSSVASIGNHAFHQCSALASVTFEDVDAVAPKLICGESTFACTNADESSLMSVALPNRLSSVPRNMFRNQSKLKNVDMGDALFYIGDYAFNNCASIETLRIPQLTSGSNQIGEYSFLGMPALTTIIFEGDEDYSLSDASFAVTKVLGQTSQARYTYPDIQALVYYGTHTSKLFTEANHYQNVTFYDSEESAKAQSESGILGSARIRSDVVSSEISTKLAGADARGALVYGDGGSVPVFPHADCSWYFPGVKRSEALPGSAACWAVSNDDFALAGISFPDNQTEFAFNSLPVDLSYVAYGPLGEQLVQGTDYDEVIVDASGAVVARSELKEPGEYQLQLNAVGRYKGSCVASFTIVERDCVWTRLDGNVAYGTRDKTIEAAFSSDNAALVIVVNAEKPILGAIANGAAGAAGGFVTTSSPDSLDLETRYELNKCKPSAVWLLGFDDAKVIRNAIERDLDCTVSSGFDGATLAQTAATLYTRTKSRTAYWDSSHTAVIGSESAASAFFSMAPYAYATASPMFCESGGSLDESTLNAIRDNAEITQVIYAGLPEAEASALDKQLKAVGRDISTANWGGASADEYQASIAIAAAANESGVLGYDKVAVFSPDNLIAAISGASVCGKNVAVMLAAGDSSAGRAFVEAVLKPHRYDITQGYFLGTAKYLSVPLFIDVQNEWTENNASDLYYASITLDRNSFDLSAPPESIRATVRDSSGKELVQGKVKYGSFGAVSVTPEDAQCEIVFIDGLTDKIVDMSAMKSAGVYYAVARAIDGSGYSNYCAARIDVVDPNAQSGKGDGSGGSGSADEKTAGGNSFKVGDTFTSGKLVYKVTGKTTIAVSKTSAGTSKTKGAVTIPNKVKGYTVASVAANAFKGCKNITKVVISSKKLADIGKGSFSGCVKLRSVSVASTSLKAIGKSAFYKCGKLASITVKSKNIKSVGSKAFAGLAKKCSVKVPSAKRKAYKKLFAKAGLASGAQVK